MKEITINKLMLPSLRLGTVRLPVIGNRAEESMDGALSRLKSHIIAWYDPMIEGITNAELAESPKLESLVVYDGVRHDLQLHNFTFDGLCGMENKYYPDSLVFNGMPPTWVYDRSNLIVNRGVNNYFEWLSNNIFKIKNGASLSKGYAVVYHNYNGTVGKPLSVNVPSFIIRVKDLADNLFLLVESSEFNGVTYKWNRRGIFKNDTYILPSYSITIEPHDENKACMVSDCRISIQKDDGTNITPDDKLDFTVEFLPNYAKASTANWADIPTIPLNKVKCMMMDFVPLANLQDQWYYTQRTDYNRKFAVINYGSISTEEQDISKIIAYSPRNILDTYIDGTKNTDKTVLSLLQQRQVVSVNDANPKYNAIYIGHEGNSYRDQQMALHSLILFDKELSGSEMRLVMKTLMKDGDATFDSFDNDDFNDDFN